jgi:FMN phosphatase YigB (HAD superfamily)
MIKNIFLDAGGVILKENNFESNSAIKITKIINQYKNYSVENYWNDVNEAVYRFVPNVYNYVLFKNLENMEIYNISKVKYKNEVKSYNFLELMDGIRDFLKEFSKFYEISSLEQYGIEFKKKKKKEELLEYFAYKEIQDNYKVTKPDPRYFEQILKNCNCLPEESLMIGDRIDKDIIPAKIIGMKTGIHKNQEPRIPEEIAEITVNDLMEIKKERINEL